MSRSELSPLEMLCVYIDIARNIALIMARQQEVTSVEDKEGEYVCRRKIRKGFMAHLNDEWSEYPVNIVH